jgi:hypothetical protein
MSTLSPPLTSRPAPATMALLWDLDNVTPPREHLASLAAVVSALLEPDAPRIVAAHRRAFRTCQATLTALGMQVLSGGRRRNGADRVLLRHAQVLSEHGVERFIIASNDHRFARIATFADLHVLSLTDAYVSRRLRAAARSVTVLTLGDRGWETRKSRDLSHPVAVRV